MLRGGGAFISFYNLHTPDISIGRDPVSSHSYIFT
jgi:hypothetical protein